MAETEIPDLSAEEKYESSCFELLTPDQNKLIEQNSVKVIYKKGETICKQGAFASHVIMLEEGLVKIYLEGNPKNIIISITTAGHLVGLPSIFEGNNTFPYSVSTYVDTTVKLIDLQIFKRILQQNPAFSFRIINILNEHTTQAYNRFYCLTRKQLNGRLADILLCIARKVFKSYTFDLPLSRNDLGELTGMSTESVIRIMKDFKDDGIIKMNGKSISLVDIGRLEKISEIG